LAVEAIISASPEYFRPDHPERAGHWDSARLEAWRAKVEPWIAEKFPNAVSVVLHLDEATPHYQIIDVPLDERGRLNARAKYGGGQKLKEWQDEVAQAVASLGIKRGVEGSLAKHERVKSFYARVNAPLPPIPVIKTPRPDPLPPRAILESMPLTEAKAARDAAESAFARQATDYTKEVEAQTQAIIEAWPHAAEKAKAVESAAQKRKQAEATTSKYAAAAVALKAQADRLRALDLGEVLERVYGATLAKGSKASHRSRKYKLPGGGEIAISQSEGGGEVWIEQETSQGKKGAINLVMHLDGVEYKDAVRLLADHFDTGSIAADRLSTIAPKVTREIETAAIQEPAPIPTPSEEKWAHVRQWLINDRGLPDRLVDIAYKKNRVFADSQGNAVFPRAAGGAFIRGTGKTRFFRTVGGKASGPFVIDGPGECWICEAPLDALSIKAVNPEARIIALSGGMLRPSDVVEHVPPGRAIRLGFDADEKGDCYARDAAAIWPSAIRCLPPSGKDWNDSVKDSPGMIHETWITSNRSRKLASDDHDAPLPSPGP
jgi:hypothetical protein